MCKLLIIFCILFLTSSKQIDRVDILPIQCHNNPYIDKILDSLRIEESSNGKHLLNINRDKRGKEISRDEGPYQHNNKCSIIFANCYNEGKKYNPYDEETSRRISRQIIIDNYKYCGNWFEALVMYNCGISGWLKGKVPNKSIIFARNILRRVMEK